MDEKFVWAIVGAFAGYYYCRHRAATQASILVGAPTPGQQAQARPIAEQIGATASSIVQNIWGPGGAPAYPSDNVVR